MAACDTADQRGVPRDDGTCDSGSVEVLPPPDTTGPEVSVTGIEDGSTHGDSEELVATATAMDDGSGVASVVVRLDGQRLARGDSPQSVTLALWELALGDHQVRVVATDEAGNVTRENVDFTIETSIADVLANLDRFTASGAITAREARAVVLRVELAQRHLDGGRIRPARNQLLHAADKARDIDDDDVRALLLRDLSVLIDDLAD